MNSGGGDQGQALLSILGLRVSYVTRQGLVEAVRGVDLELHRHEVLGVVGESGSGKSTVAGAILKMVPPPGRITTGQVLYRKEAEVLDVLAITDQRLAQLRGSEIALIPQNCRAALNPLLSVGHQLGTIMRAHGHNQGRDRSGQRNEILDLLASCGFKSPQNVYGQYPYQLSGGMAQRVLIAYALCREPSVLIADEPTTGLDPPVQTQILNIMLARCRERGVAALMITHDVDLVARYCQNVAIMCSGVVVEYGAVGEVLNSPRHGYTRDLLGVVTEASLKHERVGVEVKTLVEKADAGDVAPLAEVAPRHWVRADG